MKARLLEVHEATCGYRGREVVRGISLSLDRGKVLCVLGPNGCGKTTLFKTVLGFLALQSGRISVQGKDVGDYSPRELARRVAYVPQSQPSGIPFSVSDVVTMGRCAHLGTFAAPDERDRKKTQACLRRLGIAHLAPARYAELSGGERQMVLIARALAQDPALLVMDEPTSNLDLGNQIRVLSTVNDLASSGIGVIMTTHFPNHSFLAGDSVAVMKEGRIESAGAPAEVITESLLRSVFGVSVRIVEAKGANGARVKSCVPMMTDGL